MSSRSAGRIPSPTMCARMSLSRCSIRLLRIARWTSSNLGASMGLTGVPHDLRRTRGLFRQDWHRGHIGVPFDERRHRAEPGERIGVECPDFRCDAGPVVIDAQGLAVGELTKRMASEVDLADRLLRKPLEVAG